MNDPDAPVDAVKRAVLAIGGFGGAFVAAYTPELAGVVALPESLIEPARWIACTVSGLCGWGHARTSEPAPPKDPAP